MKTLAVFSVVILVTAMAVQTDAKIIVVNTTNNVSPGPGETNLVQAINLLQNGDTIQFNIPGTGPFYLITPPLTPDNGYPAITNHNVTIDGYSQPGASPNTNPILGSNNANIQIVLDSRAGGRRVENIPGYGSRESAALFVKGATNVNIRGLCFLGPGLGSDTSADPVNYAIAFALGANAGHVNGCWIGIDLDGMSVHRFRAGVTGFEGPGLTYIHGTVIGVAKTAANAAVAREQFNVIVGEYYPIILEGQNHRIAGNFLNVFPSGVTDYNVNGIPPYNIGAFVAIGRRGSHLVIGTDGDGLNDAEERNIFGGVTVAGDNQLVGWYGGQRTNMIIAGNYFGLGVDGITRFTNSMKVFGSFHSTTTVRVGSDFDGVSDELEGNVIAMNYPFDALFPTPGAPGPPIFASLDAGARVSLRRNRLVGNNIPPFSYADGFGSRLTAFRNYYAPFMVTNQIIPVLSTNSTQGLLKGSCALGVGLYTNIIIDVYLADDEAWTNGQRFALSELMYTDPVTAETRYYGFAQGRTYLGSFVDNGPQDLDPAPGQFEFNIASFNVDLNALVTVAANYSADPPGAQNGRTHTSPFATPVTLRPAPRMTIATSGASVTISWPTNHGLFTIQSTPAIGPPSWADLNPQPVIVPVGTDYQASVSISGSREFFRLVR